MTDLTSAIEKWRRAKHHTVALENAIATFANTDICTIRPEFDAQAGKKTWHVVGDPSEPPLQIQPIIGDVFYNLRGTLDHTATACVEKLGGIVTKNVGFPLYSKTHQWKSGAVNHLPGTGAEPDAMRALMKTYQPAYATNTLKAAALRTFEELSIMDKHHKLNLSWACLEGGLTGGNGPNPISRQSIHDGILHDGTILATAYTHNPDVDFYPIFGITFGETGPTARSLIHTMILIATDLLEEFDHAFFSGTLKLGRADF